MPRRRGRLHRGRAPRAAGRLGARPARADPRGRLRLRQPRVRSSPARRRAQHRRGLSVHQGRPRRRPASAPGGRGGALDALRREAPRGPGLARRSLRGGGRCLAGGQGPDGGGTGLRGAPRPLAAPPHGALRSQRGPRARAGAGLHRGGAGAGAMAADRRLASGAGVRRARVAGGPRAAPRPGEAGRRVQAGAPRADAGLVPVRPAGLAPRAPALRGAAAGGLPDRRSALGPARLRLRGGPLGPVGRARPAAPGDDAALPRLGGELRQRAPGAGFHRPRRRAWSGSAARSRRRSGTWWGAGAGPRASFPRGGSPCGRRPVRSSSSRWRGR